MNIACIMVIYSGGPIYKGGAAAANNWPLYDQALVCCRYMWLVFDINFTAPFDI
jgi:hypothetical protein